METKIVIRARETAGRVFKNISAKIRQATISAKKFITAKPSLEGIIAAGRRMARVFSRNVVRGFGLARRAAGAIGGVLRNVLMGGITAVVGGAALAGRALGGMRDALEGAEEGAGGAGEAAEESAADFGSAAEKTAEAAETAKIAFGAFGAVGEGFVMKQGSITEAAAKSADSAAKSAKTASKGLKKTTADLGKSAKASTRFGKALSRIGKQFDLIKKKVLAAVAKAILPALEKLADFMESPAFQKFVDLLAKDLANAAAKVGKWIETKLIPKVSDLIKEINKAGGIVAWFRLKWEELKTTVLKVVAIILGSLLIAGRAIKTFFTNIWTAVTDFILGAAKVIGDTLLGIGTAVTDIFGDIGTDISTVFSDISTTISGAFDDIGTAISDAVEDVDTIVQNFEDMGADIAEAFVTARQEVTDFFLGLPAKFEEFKTSIETAFSTIGSVITDVLDQAFQDILDRFPFIQDLLDLLTGGVDIPEGSYPGLPGNSSSAVPGFTGAESGGDTYNISVTVPAGTTDPTAFGVSVGDAIVTALRRSGQRIPAI